jgi:hypothetical protein
MIYTSNPFYSDKTNKLDKNWAGVYGDDLASYPKQLKIIAIDNNDEVNRVKITNRQYSLRNL